MKKKSVKPNHLFICFTPLHVLIAEKIIKLEGINSYALLFYYKNDTTKSRYYYNILAKNAVKSFYIKKDNKVIHAIKSFISLFFQLRKHLAKQPILYTGNIKTMYSRFVVFTTKSKHLHTFDDGIGNVCGEGYFYEDTSLKWYSGLLSFFKINLSYSLMYSLIRKHYTIYKGENIMPFATYINLFNFDSKAVSKSTSSISVLITSTLYEDGFLDLDSEKKMYEELIKTFNVNYVIPHPLEHDRKTNNDDITIITSDKIAEDIIVDLKSSYDKITVIGWYSSALVHLSGIDGIEPVNVHFDTDIPLEKTKAFFDSYGITTYKVSVIKSKAG